MCLPAGCLLVQAFTAYLKKNAQVAFEVPGAGGGDSADAETSDLGEGGGKDEL